MNFHPTVFENIKVALENELYDMDNLDGEVTVSGRSDLLDMAVMGRELSLRFTLPGQRSVEAEIVLSSSLRELAAELLADMDSRPGAGEGADPTEGEKESVAPRLSGEGEERTDGKKEAAAPQLSGEGEERTDGKKAVAAPRLSGGGAVSPLENGEEAAIPSLAGNLSAACRLRLRFHMELDREEEQCPAIEAVLQQIWQPANRPMQTISKSFGAPKDAKARCIAEIHFDRGIGEEQMEDLPELLRHMAETLRGLHPLL